MGLVCPAQPVPEPELSFRAGTEENTSTLTKKHPQPFPAALHWETAPTGAAAICCTQQPFTVKYIEGLMREDGLFCVCCFGKSLIFFPKPLPMTDTLIKHFYWIFTQFN